MGAQDVRDELVRQVVASGGRLTLAGLEAAMAVARRGGTSGSERRALARPGHALRGHPDLRGLALSIDPDAAERVRQRARGWGLTPDLELGPPPGAAPEPAGAPAAAPAGGLPLGDPKGWSLRLPGCTLRFATEALGQAWPALVLEGPRPEDLDPDGATGDLPTPDLAAMADRLGAAPDPAAALRAEAAALRPWLDADDRAAAGANARFAAARARRRRLLDAALAALAARPDVGLGAGARVVELHDELLHGRPFHMQVGSHTNYWPYWDNYLGVVEALGRQLPAGGDAARAVEARARDVRRRKTVFSPHIRRVDEHDAERALGAAVVWQAPHSLGPGHRASVVPGSDPMRPRFEALRVPDPAGGAALPVFRAGDGLVYDQGAGPLAGQPVPAELAAGASGQPVPPADLHLRALLPGEAPRPELPFDWSANGGIDVPAIDIGWWGHCHNEAPANAMGVDPRAAVRFYRADPAVPEGARLHRYSADDCWDIVGSFTADHEGERVRDPATGAVSQPGYVQLGGGGTRPAAVDQTTFVGDRNNGGHSLRIDPDAGRRVRIEAEVVELWHRSDPTQRYPDPMARFRRDIEDADGGFAPNPDWLAAGADDGDLIEVDALGRRLTLKTTFIGFTAQGRRAQQERRPALDPAVDAFVHLADEIERVDPAGGGRLVAFHLNPATRTLRLEVVEVAADAGFARRTVEQRDLPVKALVCVQETPYDSVAQIDDFVVRDIGLPFTFDTSSGLAVWNYPVNYVQRDVLRRIERDEGSERVSYTTLRLRFDTMGGPSGEPRYILKRDARGRLLRALALDPMPDFAFRQDRWVCALVTPDHFGRPAVNLRALRAGYGTAPDGQRLEPALWRLQAAVLYASLRAPAGVQEVGLVEDADGELFWYDDLGAFAAAVAAAAAPE